MYGFGSAGDEDPGTGRRTDSLGTSVLLLDLIMPFGPCLDWLLFIAIGDYISCHFSE